MIALRRAETLFFCTLCATGLWGQAARMLPAPFDDWYAIPYRAFGHSIVGALPSALSQETRLALWHCLEAYVFAFLLPLLLLRSFRLTPARAGLRRPLNRGVKLTLAGILCTLPVGFYLATTIADPWGSPLRESLLFLTLLPEHFLVFGVFGVLLMPQRELAWPSRESGQAAGALFALIATSTIFLLIHVGARNDAEVIASLVNGIVFSAVTIGSGSIWPAIIAHCTLNLVPMAALATT